MIPELGQFSLILALGVALVQGVFPTVGGVRGDLRLMGIARPAAAAQFLVMSLAYACLTAAFVRDDFSVLYVAQNSNSMLPAFYKITAVWGGHEGSMLLWVFILSAWTAAVAAFSQRLPLPTVAGSPLIGNVTENTPVGMRQKTRWRSIAPAGTPRVPSKAS